jgi:predicted chitinase
MVDARIEQMKTRDALQSLVEKGVGPATSALEGFSSFLNKITGIVPGTTSKETEKKIGGDGDKKAPPAPAAAGGGTPPALKQDQAQNMELIKSALAKQGITDTKYVAATLGNVMKETQGRSIAENLDYRKTDNKRIQEIFGSRVAGKSASEIDQMKSSPENFGEAMYGAKTDIGRRMGNMEPGDGWKYRGRGFIQLTGKSNYAEASRAIYGDDRLVKDPDLVLQPLVAAEVTAWYMKKTQGMAKGMGINIKDMSQEQANVLATSQVAGRDVRKAGGYLGGENLDKVNQYAAQQLKTTQVASAPVDTAQDPYFKPFAGRNRAGILANQPATTQPATAVTPVEKKETNPRRMTTADRLRQEQEKARALLGNVITREGHEQDLEPKKTTAKDSKNTMPQGEIVGTGDPAKISGANGFRGMLTGPTSGYKPDLTMHGTEQLTIKPTANTETSPGSIGANQIMTQQLSKMDQLVQAFNNTNTQDMMSMQLDRLDELVRVMQNQVSVSTKILQQSR